ncbi:MAG: hypothetical protein ACI9J2_000315 [Saprospiraceae bacterium]|jgi:hypothetical protein
MIDSQQPYLNRLSRLSKLKPLQEQDFLRTYSDDLMHSRIARGLGGSAGKSRDSSALILGPSSNQLYDAMKGSYEIVNQFPLAKLDSIGCLENFVPVDTVVCSHLIDWFDPNALLPQAIDSIKPSGELFFSFYGENTTLSLADLIASEDSKPHFQPKYAMSDVGDHIAGLGLSNVVLDSERVNLEYTSVEKLIKDAKLIDGANFHADRRRGLMPKGIYQRIIARLEAQLKAENVLTIEIELCFGRGVKKDTSSVNVGIPTIQNY